MEVFAHDAEFRPNPDGTIEPVCWTAKSLNTGEVVQLVGEGIAQDAARLRLSEPGTLHVTYFAPAESAALAAAGVYLTPTNVIDLFAEEANRTNMAGKAKVSLSLLSSLARRGIGFMQSQEKDAARELILSKSHYSDEEMRRICAYNLADVDGTLALYSNMAQSDEINAEHAKIRGKYSWLCGQIEYRGVPVDKAFLDSMAVNREVVISTMLTSLQESFPVFEGGALVHARLVEFFAKNKIDWPVTTNGRLDLRDETWKERLLHYPWLSPLRQFLETRSNLRQSNFIAGMDSRLRIPTSPFRTITGRNAPSAKRNIFAAPKWMRGAIRANDFYGLAVIDQSQQEFGVAAALSGDANMMAAYAHGDPYMQFAIQAGAAPEGATKATHAAVRELYKACVLAVQYGMGAESLAARIGKSKTEASYLLEKHHLIYPHYWRWQERVLHHAAVTGTLHTAFGWQAAFMPDGNPRTVANFPMQGNGSEILRIATILADQRGIEILALIHDAVVIQAPAMEVEAQAALMADAFSDASAIVLDGFRLRSDIRILNPGERYLDEKTAPVFEKYQNLLKDLP